MLPYLPAEILYLIFEFAASDATTASTLDALNYEWRTRTGSLLYHTLVLHTAPALIGIVENLRTAPTEPERIRRPRQFYADTVRHVSIIGAKVPFHYVQIIYESCIGIVTLEVDHWFFAPQPATPVRVRDLIVPSFPLEVDLRSSAFTEITHLWIAQPVLSHLLPKVFFPKLKYLAIPLRSMELRRLNESEWSHQLDAMIPNLQLMIINFIETYQYITTVYHDDGTPCHDRIWAIFLSRVNDPRIQVRLVKGSYKHETRTARMKGISLWERAIQESISRDGIISSHSSSYQPP
ncbi:hypothetical protein FRC14_002129 [Serendipita sp. 396]|nr:hypothetical protein FRC14_002129 [Serendipita sp. 396]KAG8791117.1 hypothetical protein FRC16_000576 [Serendipita sp. 398]KAG9051612.1 hypothetical protein FS842_011192 [Serendipita sp. 407]